MVELFQNVERLWQADVLPIRSEGVVTRSKQDEEALNLLRTQTTRVLVDGINRHATPLLRKKDMPLLQAPKEAVLPNLRSTEKRLERDPIKAAAYKDEIKKLEVSGYAHKLPPGEVDTEGESWFIPHHIVQHNGKNRVVFNCSFQFRGHSLNEYLLPGPALGPSLLGVLLRFREHTVAVSADIRGMFHQVRLLPEDRHLLRFVWRIWIEPNLLMSMSGRCYPLAPLVAPVVPFTLFSGTSWTIAIPTKCQSHGREKLLRGQLFEEPTVT